MKFNFFLVSVSEPIGGRGKNRHIEQYIEVWRFIGGGNGFLYSFRTMVLEDIDPCVRQEADGLSTFPTPL